MDAVAAAKAATAGWVREQQTRQTATQPATEPAQGTHHNRLSQVSTTSSNASKRSRQHIGPWQLGRTLGRGSSGRVRLAKHGDTGQLAAVKIVPKSAVGSLTQENSVPYGIEREVIIMKLIEHPNIMGLYDVWENKGELYLILEYIEGGELFDYLISRGRLPEREAVHYFRQICYGVDYCHQFNICHRDLKPENLLLDKNRNIKIADFGMAALETQGRMLETSCGSPHYASPEIVAGKSYHGAPSDIWSCGIILFALLTGHLPFDDDSIRKLLLKVQSGVYTLPRNLSPEARDLISRMLLVDPNKRISMKEILAHPLLAKYPYRRVPAENREFRDLFDAYRPVSSPADIDVEILRNLQTLWHRDNSDKIVQRLLSPEPNPEKTFYCLLLKYRQNHSRTRTPPRHEPTSASTPQARRSKHRRQASAASHRSHRSALSSRSMRSHRSINRARGSVVASRSRNGSRYSIASVASRRPQYRRQDESPEGANAGAAMPQAAAAAAPRASRASSQFAELLDQAFNFDEPRAVSATLDPAAVPVVSERRTASEPTPVPHTLDPRQSVAFDFEEPEAAAVPEAVPQQYLLPMIFEEDRFADAIEEEVELKVHKRRRPQGIVVNDDNSRLQISNLVSGESFCSYQPTAAAAAVLPPVRPAPQPPRQRGELAPFTVVADATKSVSRKPVPSMLDLSSQKSINSLAMPSPPIVRPSSQSPTRPALADRSNQANGESNKTKESFFRRITPRRLRAPAPAPTPAPEPVQASPAVAEPRQNWLVKMLNLGPHDATPPSRVLRSTLDTTELQSVILEVMEEWSRFGLRIQHIDANKNTISAAIASRNVLRMRQAHFTIRLKPIRLESKAAPGSAAEIARENGSRKSFLRFVTELDRVLRNMNVLE